ncbi:MAG: hypothetical protein ABSA92_10945 [Candidatus Bathyarchaeia archaeon]
MERLTEKEIEKERRRKVEDGRQKPTEITYSSDTGNNSGYEREIG